MDEEANEDFASTKPVDQLGGGIDDQKVEQDCDVLLLVVAGLQLG